MKQQQLSKESTIYHYRLLRRIHYKPLYRTAYWSLPAIVFLWDLIRLDPLPMLISVAAIPLLHTLLIYLYFTLKEKRPLRQWKWDYRFPWTGYVPANYIALYRIVSLHLHLLWVTVVVCGCFYPWVSFGMIAHLLFIHAWLLLPRLFILFMLRKHTENGYLKLNEHDTSCYEQ